MWFSTAHARHLRECIDQVPCAVQAAMAARHALTQHPLQHPGLRVVSYNILADQYAATDKAKQLFYPQNSPE